MTTITIPCGLLGGLGGTQLIFIILIVLLIFGSASIPKIMRNVGKGVHSFRQGLEDAKSEMRKEIKKADDVAKDSDSAEEPKE